MLRSVLGSIIIFPLHSRMYDKKLDKSKLSHFNLPRYLPFLYFKFLCGDQNFHLVSFSFILKNLIASTTIGKKKKSKRHAWSSVSVPCRGKEAHLPVTLARDPEVHRYSPFCLARVSSLSPRPVNVASYAYCQCVPSFCLCSLSL